MAQTQQIGNSHFLIIGISGALARSLASHILTTFPKARITGVDSRDAPKDLRSSRLEFQKIKYNRTNFERVFRAKKIDYVFHLGRLSHAISKAHILERADVNVVGTLRILELALRHGIKKSVVLSTYHVYGAYHDNPLYIPESYPLRASFRFDELHDVVEMDQSATTFMWRNQHKMETLILRPCNIIGHDINNAMSLYLKSSFGPLPMDYRPMFQFIHKSDMTRILLRSIEELPIGVYNVAPDDTISLARAKKLLGKSHFKVPISFLGPLKKLVRLSWPLPQYFFDYLRFSCVIDSSEIKSHLGPDFCQLSTESAIKRISKSV